MRAVAMLSGLERDFQVTPAFECDWDRFREVAPPSLEIGSNCLTTLACALSLEAPPYRRALSEPPGSETTVFELEPAFVAALATASSDRHAALGRAMCDDQSEGDAASLFGGLVDLARRATEAQCRLYLIEER